MSCRVVLSLTAAIVLSTAVRADIFDYYTNSVLARLVEAEGLKEQKEISQRQLIQHDRVLTATPGTFLVIKTNQGRWAKLLVQVARHRMDESRYLPMLLVERYVTFREGEERTIQASAKDVALYPGFRLSLDLGQIVPEELGGDLRVLADNDKLVLAPIGKARLYLVNKELTDVVPKKGPKLVVGTTFEMSYFNGSYKLYDDGRRSGVLKLKVEDDGTVSGAYYSDRDGQKYEVSGKIGTPQYSIQFTIKFPRSEQVFQGWLFTGDGQVLTGSSRLVGREAGFYAKRIEE
jgi:hypothetical protein